MNLTEFLLARIADREQIARAAGGEAWDVDHGAVTTVVAQRSDVVICQTQLDEHARHIGWNSPADALADCQAKRRIIELAGEASSDREAVIHEYSGSANEERRMRACDPGWLILQALALRDADHEDYREEWRP